VSAEVDPLRRVERTALLVCAVMAAVASVVSARPVEAAVGVVGGGILAAASYRALKGLVNGLTGAGVPRGSGADERRNAAGMLARLVLRYALLALLAYVMIARLRLHPVGLLAGASSVVAAVSIEAVRLLMKKS
jgi:hypothetical protein